MFGKLFCAGLLSFVLSGIVLAESPQRDRAEVSADTLSAMGLEGMQSLSDEQSAQVRGKFTYAASYSYASGIWKTSSNPPPSTSNPAFVKSWAVGVGPGITFSRGFAYAASY